MIAQICLHKRTRHIYVHVYASRYMVRRVEPMYQIFTNRLSDVSLHHSPGAGMFGDTLRNAAVYYSWIGTLGHADVISLPVVGMILSALDQRP